MRVNRRNSGVQCFVLRDENNIGIVSRERLDVVDRRERAAESVVFNQTSGDEFVRRAKNISERDCWRFLAHSRKTWKTFTIQKHKSSFRRDAETSTRDACATHSGKPRPLSR